MNFKRGIFCGVIVTIGSLDGLYEMYRMKNITACALYMLALIMGVTQILVSLEYEKLVKKRILLLCFSVEGIYCAASVIYLLTGNAVPEVKLFGMVAGIVYCSFIFPSIYSLCKNYSSIKKEML